MAKAKKKDEFDISKALEQGTKKMSLEELQQKGHQNVKVLDEKTLQELVTKAVDRVVVNQTSEERARVLADSRKELDRLMREQKAVRSRAELLEADRNELVAQVESLQRELELQSELEEENLHKKFQEGTASMQGQVEQIREQLKAARAEAGELRERLAGEEARVRGAEQARQDLVQQVLKLQSDLEPLRDELKAAKTDLVRQRADATRAVQELEGLRRQLADEREARARAEGAGAAVEAERKAREAAEHEAWMLKSRCADLERAVEEARSLGQAAREEARQGSADSARLLEEARAAAEKASRLLADEQMKSESARQAELSLKSDLRRLEDERDRSRKALDESRAELGRLVQKADGLQVELAALREESARSRPEIDRLVRAIAEEQVKAEAARSSERGFKSDLERAVAERTRLAQELEEAREQVSVLRQRVEREEEEAALRRQQSVVVASQLDEIEETRHAEERELERLRAEAAGIRASEERLVAELAQARQDIRSLYELLAREQGLAKTAQDESVELHAKAMEILGRSGDLERYVGELRQSRGRAELALQDARRRLAEKPPPPPPAPRVVEVPKEIRERLEKLQQTAAEARKTTQAVRALVAKQAKPPAPKTVVVRRGPGTPREGVALDGRGLLGEYLRRIRLKELFQKHVPVRDRHARRHPSELLVELVEAVAAGDPRAGKPPKGARIEVVGPQSGSTLDELRAFQGRLSPVAVRSLERVHDGLRNALVPPPSRSERLVLDVDLPELEVGRRGRLGRHRPLVAFDGARGEFWKARLRSAKGEAADGALPFLKGVLSKLPKAAPRERVLLRLDGRLFSEPVIRFLERSKVGYVIPAPDSKELRAASRKAPLRDVSEGAQVGEFRLRLHPIRKTEGRFVVVRRRVSKRNPPPVAPTFTDGAFAFTVFAADAKTGPWRAWTEMAERPAALAAERALLAGFGTSPLAGKGRRAQSAAFRSFLLASDLMQWFKRAALPPSEQGRTQDSLRRELLMLAPPGEKRPETTVLVLPRKDQRRKVYEDVSRRLERVRPGAPFKLGR